MLRITTLVVLDTSKYDSVQIHYRFIDSHLRVFLCQFPFSIGHVSPALEISLVYFHDLIDSSRFTRDAKGISSYLLFVSPHGTFCA